jgi:small-conductance mechanosensitive channel
MTTLSPTPGLSAMPTASPTLVATAPVEQWILFAVFVFLFGISQYISRILMAVLSGFASISPDLVVASKTELQQPLTHTLAGAFLLIAVGFFPVNIPALIEVMYYIARFYLWVAIFFACFRLSKFIIMVLNFFMIENETQNYVRKGIVEFMQLVRTIVLVIILLVLISFFPLNGNLDAVSSIFLSVNLVTATLAVMFAPMLRNLVAGLNVLIDQQIKAGDVVSIPGICKIGRLQNVSLRQAHLESFSDGAVYRIPTITFLRTAISRSDPR